jgi:two-component system NtrC family sensor kinase
VRRRGKAVKKQRSKSLGRRITAKGVRRRKPSTVDPIERIALLTRERDEALEQQTATSEVLKVLSRSMFDLQPVLDTLVEKAVRLSGADRGFIFRQDGDLYRVVASFGHSKEFIEIAKQNPIHQDRGSATGRAILERGTVHIHDIQADPEYRWAEDHSGEEEMHRTILAVPMLRESEITGVIVIRRVRVQPFTDKQIELVQNFAAQAVIAIENTRLLTELRESLQQQMATADVLKVISRSTFDLQPVLDTLTESAAQLCEADIAAIIRQKGDAYYWATSYGLPPDSSEYAKANVAIEPGRATVAGRALQEGKTVQVADVLEDREYAVTAQKAQKIVGHRATLGVPLMREGSPIGVVLLMRRSPKPFSDRQIELVETFADQAVIAIENVRLFDEVQAQKRELTETLEHQTATSEVLSVISRSPTNAQPVFDAIAESAARLCEAVFTVVWLYDGDLLHYVSSHNFTVEVLDQINKSFPKRPDRSLAAGRAILDGKIAHVPDMLGDPVYAHQLAMAGNWRASLAVPMLRDGKSVGAISVGKAEAGPFKARQMQLLTTFADQAVIAIENVRLFDEVQKRTEELSEALSQQTATSEVLSVISRSRGELEPVFDIMLANATKLCDASYGAMWLSEGGALRNAAFHGEMPKAFTEQWRTAVIPPGQDVPVARVVLSRKPVQVADLREDNAYLAGHSLAVGSVDIAGMRSLVVVPMLKEDEFVGAFAIYRKEVRPFTEKQIELVQNFAAQAIIAIENTRLLNELRESLQQQTATADVLKVISRSTFDLQVVLDTLVESAARLCEADSASIHRPVGGSYPYVASCGLTREYDEYMRERPLVPGRGTVLGRAITELKPVQINDVTADPEYTLTEARNIGGFRTVLGVPLLREGAPIGIIMLTRNMVRPFTDKQIELVSTFADQAAIAIENVRLFESVEARTRELAKSLEELHATQDRLVQTQKLASLGQLTAGIAHEIKNPLNFVNNFSGVSAELVDELQETLKDVSLNEKRRGEITELMDTLRGNLEKVVQHGRRADAIVKNMLLHSREGSGEHRLVGINALVEEGLNLAYHGARAEKQGFNIKLEKSFDPNAGEADVFPQDITRVLLNLISNGFYAATKRRADTNGGDYEPTLAAATKNRGDRVEITIRDNGTGIPADVKERMFNPFFTTKPAGEGTGLGLSISHDIIVKQHGGSIEVDTEPGEFTEIRVVLPRAIALLPDQS